MALKLKRVAEVADQIGYSISSVWRLVEAGTFPSPIQLSESRSAWLEHEVEAWIEERLKERDEALASRAQARAEGREATSSVRGERARRTWQNRRENFPEQQIVIIGKMKRRKKQNENASIITPAE